MSVRRKTTNRLILFRNCHTCGKGIVTTADSPFIRQMPADGKKQKTCYFCGETCHRASYAHPGWWDGLADVRKAERDAARSKEKNRRYYAAHAEKERKRARERYWSDPDSTREDNRYQRKKRRLQNEI